MKYKTEIVVGLLILVAVAGLFGSGYVVGKHNQGPAKVVTVTKEHETVKETQVVNQKVDLQEIRNLMQEYQKTAQAHVVTRVVTTKAPDGTVTTTTTKDAQTASKVDSKTSQETKVAEKTETKTDTQKERIVDRVVTVEVQRGVQQKWNLSLGAGVNVPAVFGGQAPNNLFLIPGKYVGHLSLTRHLLGPFSGGPFANTRGDAGLLLEVKW